ncbi:hypothetical protein MKW92_044570 [Papaver armeniacum]|nr:hypothetical protein MKW92_044570 [Papaver armeniacum]
MEPRRSPRFMELARLRELAETDTEKKKQLRHAQYKARQEKMTDHENRLQRKDVGRLIKIAKEELMQQVLCSRRSPRIELQQRELQLEKQRITKRDRRSSLTENQKEEVLEKRRRTYEIRRARVREATNNEHRAGPKNPSRDGLADVPFWML